MPAVSKRKRELNDQGQMSVAPSPDYMQYLRNTEGADDDLAMVLQRHNNPDPSDGNDEDAQHSSDTANAALNFAIGNESNDHNAFIAAPEGQPDHGQDVNFDLGTPQPSHQAQYQGLDPSASAAAPQSVPGASGDEAAVIAAEHDTGEHPEVTNDDDKNDNLDPTTPHTGRRTVSTAKVGTDEWHADRRRAHKDVERRRRDVINEGINELAKLVPGNGRGNNKGGILSRAVTYIVELKDKQASAEEKNGLAKLMFETTVAELNATADRLAAENRALQAENERLRKGVKA